MKRSFSLLLCLLFALAPAAAQRVVKSAEQQLVEDAVRDGLFCVRSGFQLRQVGSDEYFGRNGREEFGASYAIGVKLPGGYCLSAPSVRPWDYDEAVQDFAADYAPVPYVTEMAPLSQSLQFQPLEQDAGKAQALSSELLYRFEAKTFGDTAFVTDPYRGEKEGWAVWVTMEGTAGQGAVTDFMAYRHRLDVVSDSTSYAIPKPMVVGNREVVGGVYVVPVVTRLGQVELRLCGVMVPLPGGEWRICCPFAEGAAPRTSEAATLTPASPAEGSKDQPKKKKKKSKKKA